MNALKKTNEKQARERQIVEWFLRITISLGFLSAVAHRFGLWPEKVAAWGKWTNFVDYTQLLLPWIPEGLIGLMAGVATALELLFAMLLLLKVKTPLVALLAGLLLLTFGLSMALALGVKAPLDYSVFMGAGAAFALRIITQTSALKE